MGVHPRKRALRIRSASRCCPRRRSCPLHRSFRLRFHANTSTANRCTATFLVQFGPRSAPRLRTRRAIPRCAEMSTVLSPKLGRKSALDRRQLQIVLRNMLTGAYNSQVCFGIKSCYILFRDTRIQHTPVQQQTPLFQVFVPCLCSVYRSPKAFILISLSRVSPFIPRSFISRELTFV